MADIIQIIKKAALSAIENSSPTSIMYGVVTNIKPLEIQVEQKLLLTSEFITLTKNVIDYETEITINSNTEEENLNSNQITEKKKIIIHNGLKQNDKVILLQQQGGQKFIVIDKIY